LVAPSLLSAHLSILVSSSSVEEGAPGVCVGVLVSINKQETEWREEETEEEEEQIYDDEHDVK